MNKSTNEALAHALDGCVSIMLAILRNTDHKLDAHYRRYLEGQVEEMNNIADELSPMDRKAKA